VAVEDRAKPRCGCLGKKGGDDDYVTRLCIVLEDAFNPLRARSIQYVWSSQEQIGAIFPSPYTKQVGLIVLRSGAKSADQWFPEVHGIITDYRDFYYHIGGFPPWPLFEDVELFRKALRLASVRSIPAAVSTSSRRFQARGILRPQWLNPRLLCRFLLGASPEKLASRYR